MYMRYDNNNNSNACIMDIESKLTLLIIAWYNRSTLVFGENYE